MRALYAWKRAFWGVFFVGLVTSRAIAGPVVLFVEKWKVFKEAHASQTLEKNFKEAIKKHQQMIDGQRKNLIETYKSLATGDTLSFVQKQEKNKKLEKIFDLSQKNHQKIKQAFFSARRLIHQAIENSCQKIALSKKAQAVIDSSRFVVFFQKDLDITPLVTEDLNKNLPSVSKEFVRRLGTVNNKKH